MTRLHVCRSDECAGTVGMKQSGDCAARGHRVLIVDDNKDLVAVLRECLASEGCDVRVAYDGLTAIEIARTTIPDVVLLDLCLPGISGHHVARTLRADSRFARCRMIALTGFLRSFDRDEQRSDFDAYVTKPPTVAALVSMVCDPVER